MVNFFSSFMLIFPICWMYMGRPFVRKDRQVTIRLVFPRITEDLPLHPLPIPFGLSHIHFISSTLLAPPLFPSSSLP